MDFTENYGPWAIVAGASEGTGRSFARKIAARGVPCILIARREAPLKDLAEEIQKESGVACVTASIDLSAADAFERILEAVGEREIGLYIGNAGADPHGSRFLDKDIDTWIAHVNRSVITTMQCCHHFGGLMSRRGRGGLLLVGSGACYGGGSFLTTYAAGKAFELCFSEGLWAELAPHNVHVLYLVLGMTDTPALRKLLAEKGLPTPPGLADPDEVAELGLQRLPHGPIHNWGLEDDEVGYASGSAAQRRARIQMIDQQSKAVFGGD